MSNLDVCWSNEMRLILEEQGQACKLCHCSVCSDQSQGRVRAIKSSLKLWLHV